MKTPNLIGIHMIVPCRGQQVEGFHNNYLLPDTKQSGEEHGSPQGKNFKFKSFLVLLFIIKR